VGEAVSAPNEFEPISGPLHYVRAGYYARQAAEAEQIGQYESAVALAAIGQIHATLAAASAAALHDENGDTREWRNVTGQEAH
jgi:hypothetical protein